MSNNNICKNCGYIVHKTFCSKCGQKDSELLKLKDFLKEISKDFTELDFRILVTLKKLVTNPGFLTREYWEGKKVKYTQPFKLFLFSGIIYYLLMPTHWSEYDSEMGQEVILKENQKEVMSIIAHGYEFKIENPLLISSFRNYHLIGSKYEREINVIINPLMYTFFLMLIHLNSKNLYFSHHLITSFHIGAFSNLLYSILLIISGPIHLVFPTMELDFLSLLYSLLFLVHIVFILKNIYDNSIIITILKICFLYTIEPYFSELIIPFILTFMIMLKQMIIL